MNDYSKFYSEYLLNSNVNDYTTYEVMELTPSAALELKKSRSLFSKEKMYSFCMNDPYFLAKKNERDSIIDQCDWFVTSENQRDIDIIKERLSTIINKDVLKNIHESLYKSIAIQKIVYDPNGKVKKIVPANIGLYKYEIDEDGEKLYTLNKNNKKEIVNLDNVIISNSGIIPIDRYMGLCDSLVSKISIKFIVDQKLRPKFIDNISEVFLWANYPATTGGEEDLEVHRQLVNSMTALKNGNGIITPEGSSIEFVEVANKYTAMHKEYVDDINNDISRLLIGVVNSAEGSVGSYSALDAQIKIKQDLISNSLQIIEQAINTYLIPLLCEEEEILDFPLFKIELNKSADMAKDLQVAELLKYYTLDYVCKYYGYDINDFKIVE